MQVTKELLLESLKDIKQAKKVFEQLESESDNTIHRYQKLFGLPMEGNSYEASHRVRNKIQSAISHHYGVSHLNGAKYPALAVIYLKEAYDLCQELCEFDAVTYTKMYKLLTKHGD